VGRANGASVLRLVFAVHAPEESVAESVYWMSNTFACGLTVRPSVRPSLRLALYAACGGARGRGSG